MNLVALMKLEIAEKRITTKKEIKDYLYDRSGQLFTFDPRSAFCEPEERILLNAERINIYNVEKFEVNCFSWAYAFVDLLHTFEIPAKVVIINKEFINDSENVKKTHATVEVDIDGEIYILDLFARFEDMIRIKFNFAPQYNTTIKHNQFVPSYNKKRDLEDFFKEIKEKLVDVSTDFELSNYRVMKFLEYFLNKKSVEEGLDYITGIQFISKAFLKLVEVKKRPKNTHYVNLSNNFYAEAYSFFYHQKLCTFSFEEVEKGRYELHEVSPEKIEELKNQCDFTQGHALKSGLELKMERKL